MQSPLNCAATFPPNILTQGALRGWRQPITDMRSCSPGGASFVLLTIYPLSWLIYNHVGITTLYKFKYIICNPYKTRTGSRVFTIDGPALWNALHVSIRNPQATLTFPKLLKCNLIDLAFPPELLGGLVWLGLWYMTMFASLSSVRSGVSRYRNCIDWFYLDARIKENVIWNNKKKFHWLTQIVHYLRNFAPLATTIHNLKWVKT